MHGIKKRQQQISQLLKAKEEEKIVEYRKLLLKFNEIRAKQKNFSSIVPTLEVLEGYMKVIDMILQYNPEHYTAWNTRRIVLRLVKNELFELKLLNDLKMTFALLQSHPKSYWLFNHRRWCLLSLGDTKKFEMLKKELDFCHKMLSMDSRNFHVWDYRRWILTQMPAEPQQEYDFTTELISKNFSNYSAWHYRSKLVENYPEKFKAESDLELVHSAIFTDPKDTSAWLYFGWILNYGSIKYKAILENNLLNIIFEEPVKRNHCSNLFQISGVMVNLLVDNASGSLDQYSKHWTLCVIKDQEIFVIFPNDYFLCRNRPLKSAVQIQITSEGSCLCRSNGDAVIDIKEQEQLINELLQEEPDCINALTFMSRLSPNQQLYATLKELDSYRRNYYSDLEGKYCYNLKFSNNLSMSYYKSVTVLNLSKSGITSFDFTSIFVDLETLDLTGNLITAISKCLCVMNKLKSLVLTANPIKNVDNLKFIALNPDCRLKIDQNVSQFSFLTSKDDEYIVNVYTDEYWLLKALWLSRLSSRIKSAFSVGCVIVDLQSKQVVASGYSREIPGNTHAEQVALEKLDTNKEGKYALYSTMAPCIRRLSGNLSCVERIIARKSQISTVVYGFNEPETFVKNKTSQIQLEAKGISVRYVPLFSQEIALVSFSDDFQ